MYPIPGFPDKRTAHPGDELKPSPAVLREVPMLGSTPAATARVPLHSAPGQASVPAATGILAGLASTRTTGSHEILFHEGDPADARGLHQVEGGVRDQGEG